MNEFNFIQNKKLIIYFFILIYLFYGTGLHGDDYYVISQFSSVSIEDFFRADISLIGNKIYSLIDYYVFWLPYFLLGNDYQFIYDFIKAISILISIVLVYIFFLDYLPKQRALFTSLIFIFYPTHDTTLYWYMTIFYTITPALILFSHHLIRNNKYLIASPLLIMGTFISYASPPYLFGLSIIFFLEKKFIKGSIFILSGLSYIIYYFIISNIYSEEKRIDDSLNIISFSKNFLLQVLTFFDTFLGPSFWIKIYHSIISINLLSIFIILIVVFLVQKKFKSKKIKFNWILCIALIAVAIFSLCMFSITGYYNQMSFNLGNRITIYGSLFFAFLITSTLSNKPLYSVFVIFLLVNFGISDYWKKWNTYQKNIIFNIQNNDEIQNLNEESILLIQGDMFSKMGKFSHIDFLSVPWTVEAIFKDVFLQKNILSLTRHVVLNNLIIKDNKFNTRINLENKDIYIYNTKDNSLNKTDILKINNYLNLREAEVRHWIQLLNTSYTKKLLLFLNPRLIIYF